MTKMTYLALGIALAASQNTLALESYNSGKNYFGGAQVCFEGDQFIAQWWASTSDSPLKALSARNTWESPWRVQSRNSCGASATNPNHSSEDQSDTSEAEMNQPEIIESDNSSQNPTQNHPQNDSQNNLDTTDFNNPQAGGSTMASVYDGKCLTVEGDLSAQGAPVTLSSCHNAAQQRWTQDNQGRIHTQLNPDYCLEAERHNYLAEINVAPCNDNSLQVWNYRNNFLQQDNWVIDYAINQQTPLVYAYHGGRNQQWLANFDTPDNSASDNNHSDPEQGLDQNTSDHQADANCPANSVISVVSGNNLLARKGSIFSSSLYQYNPRYEDKNNNTHNPEPVVVRVTANGQAVSGCRVHWNTASAGDKSNGWVFPNTTKTNAQGEVSAWWMAGTANRQTLQAEITRANASTVSTQAQGRAEDLATRSNSIHINWSSSTWDTFSVDVRPLTLPATTYYSAINFPGGYTGLQTNKVLFSVWDVAGIDAQIIDPGVSTCSGFGGEGTGAKCYIDYQPQVGTDYRFEVEVSYPVYGRTDYTGYFTDMSTGQRLKLATLRYGQRQEPRGAAGFVEDWWEQGNNCLTTNERTAYFHNVRHRLGQSLWQDINTATGTGVYVKWHNEICSNYQFSAEDGKFKWSSGGSERIGQPLNLPGGAKSIEVRL